MLGSKSQRIAELEDRNMELEGQVGNTDQLRGALQGARETLFEQGQLLDRLTGQPLVYASVLSVEKNITPEAIAGMLRRGAQIRMLGGRFAGERGTVVQPPEFDFLVVRLDNGHEREVSLKGDPLILPNDDSRNYADPSAYKVQAGVSIVAGPHNGEMGIVLEPVNGSGEVLVQTDCGAKELFRIGDSLNVELLNLKVGHAVVALEGKHLEVRLPENGDVNPGDMVKLSMETAQIVDVVSMTVPGEIATVRRVMDDTSEVEFQGAIHVVINGRNGELEKGDRVVLDTSGSIILQNLGKDDERFRFTAETNVEWDDIGGLAEAKQQMIEAIELPHRQPELYEFYGKKPVKGVLLYGPPGCGKTMLGKATATALAKIYGGSESSAGFLYVKGPEILDRFVGVAEATIRQLFERARKHKEEHGYPAVIFIDEADAILGKRGTGISSDIERTIVPMFLTEMDGLEDSGAVIILATNRPDVLDPAIVRDGRIDRKIKITRPDRQGAIDIFGLNLDGVPLNNGYSTTELAEVGADTLFAKERVLYHVTLKGDGRMDLTLGNICNGGMVAGIVDQATSFAMHRDIEAGEAQGLRKEDITRAVDTVFCQNLDLNHTDELAEFTHDFRDDVVGIRRLSQSTN